jgi:hypothetical protein
LRVESRLQKQPGEIIMQAPAPKRASPDYERPRENVGNIPDPVTLPTTKARQGETSGHMRWVLYGGLALAIILLAIGYLVVD